MITLHPPKKRQKKTKYVEYDIEEINRRIYNDLPIKSYQDKVKQKHNLDSLMYEDETYKLIEEIDSLCHYITSKGRIINAQRCMELTMNNVADRKWAFHADSKRWMLEDIMAQYGFEYNFNKLKEFYKQTNTKTSWTRG
jgi:hypothetical protein